MLVTLFIYTRVMWIEEYEEGKEGLMFQANQSIIKDTWGSVMAYVFRAGSGTGSQVFIKYDANKIAGWILNRVKHSAQILSNARKVSMDKWITA